MAFSALILQAKSFGKFIYPKWCFAIVLGFGEVGCKVNQIHPETPQVYRPNTRQDADGSLLEVVAPADSNTKSMRQPPWHWLVRASGLPYWLVETISIQVHVHDAVSWRIWGMLFGDCWSLCLQPCRHLIRHLQFFLRGFEVGKNDAATDQKDWGAGSMMLPVIVIVWCVCTVCAGVLKKGL